MKKGCCIGIMLWLVVGGFGAHASENHDLRLWYDQPAEEWVEALPIGNGSLGAMVFGGVERERIQFNEDTLWTGVPRDYVNAKALETLPEVRQLLFEGKQSEAEDVAWDMMSDPVRQEAYQPFGDVILEFAGHSDWTNYERELDLHEGITRVGYEVDGVNYTREIFSSYPGQAIVMRITSDQSEALDCDLIKKSPHPESEVRCRKDGEGGLIRLFGQVQDREEGDAKKPCALRFESRLWVESDGEITERDGHLSVRNASQIVLKLCAGTSYNNYRDIDGIPAQKCEENLAPVQDQTYEALKNEHIEDYQKLFQRMSLDLGTSEASEKPTNERIENFAQQNDPQLVELYFQFGRYLLISSSRPGSQPANLQGIWNEEMNPPWESKWTVNINTEMNYWPAEMTNLSECHEPLFSMLEDLTVTGGNVAKEHYGCRGWVLHHNTDVWRGAAPINATNHGIWMTGGAWLCQHLWFRYDYTQDVEFLREQAYPIMRGAALFFLDFLIEDPETGWLISTPSNSPEIGGLVAGPSMDHQIIRNLFSHCIQASEILGVDEDLREQWREKIERIAPNQIGQYGQLQEWLEDKDDPNNKHRHISHLWALHPGNEITPRGTPDFAEACKVTLGHRGDGGTGWSKAWKVNFWARLHDGNHAYKMFSELISKSTLSNMFDTHPPFQIDGNFGGTSGIVEMIVQSHTGEVDLLPALPDALAHGEIQGICARGGFELDITWEDGNLKKVIVHSKAGKTLSMRDGEETIQISTNAGERYTFDGELNQI